MQCITTDTGFFTAGHECVLVDGRERVVFLGSDCKKTAIPEFTLAFPDGCRREGCQYGRDFVFKKGEQ